jgi:hypothetical protein
VGGRLTHLQAELEGLMQAADAMLSQLPSTALPTEVHSRRQQMEELTAALTATTATLRAHSAAAAASSVVLQRERQLVAAETALVATQAAVLRQREAALLLQAEGLRGSMDTLQQQQQQGPAAGPGPAQAGSRGGVPQGGLGAGAAPLTAVDGESSSSSSSQVEQQPEQQQQQQLLAAGMRRPAHVTCAVPTSNGSAGRVLQVATSSEPMSHPISDVSPCSSPTASSTAPCSQ